MTAILYLFSTHDRVAKLTANATSPTNHGMTAAHEGAELWLHPFVQWCDEKYLAYTRENYQIFKNQVGASTSENAMMAVMERFRASAAASMPEGRS